MTNDDLVQRLSSRIDELEERLRAVEADDHARPAGEHHLLVPGGGDPDGHEATRPDRRRMLSIAAGAVAGGAALALGHAERADAAPGTFSGNPAVTATGTGGNGVTAFTDTGGEATGALFGSTAATDGRGVCGVSQSGIGVEGTGPIGVAGVAGHAADIGVAGTSEAGDGVRGTAVTLNGIGVHGVNAAGGTAVKGEGTAVGVHGTGGVGVKGEGASTGVRGQAAAGHGVLGHSDSAVHAGVLGENSALFGPAVTADAPAGNAVVGNAGYTAGMFIGGLYGTWAEVTSASTSRAQMVLRPLTGMPAPPSRTDSHFEGELYMDEANRLWYSVAGGSPGQWRQLSGADTAGSLHLLDPTRVYDSRATDPPFGGVKGQLSNGTRDVDCTNNGSGVPKGATGVLVNLTVVNTSATGFLAAYKKGLTFPGTSSINWNLPGTIVANTTIVAVDADATLTCLVPASSSTDFFVDVTGYFR